MESVCMLSTGLELFMYKRRVIQFLDLFGAAIAKVGVMDMIRYDKLGVGFWWVEEYGSSTIKEHFRNLMSYSPLHNVQKYMLETIQYPAILG